MQGRTAERLRALPPVCKTTTCDETSKSCATVPGDEGSSCAGTFVCSVKGNDNGVCKSGQCVGEPKDCSFAPQGECNTMACNPITGDCEPTPDATKNGETCVLTGDLCMLNRTCYAGQCLGGTPIDCSSLTVGCTVGMCNPTNGSCEAKTLPLGSECFDGITACNVSTCDVNAACVSTALADGTSCTDSNSCTSTDVCSAGTCTGAAVTGCVFYLKEDFETCPAGWTFGGDWQCGIPKNVGPTTAHTGARCIATQISDGYNYDQEETVAVADSPLVSLVTATNPRLSFWTWLETRYWDGFTLKVSTDGGVTFNTVMAVMPQYTVSVGGWVGGVPMWSGPQSGLGWQPYTADLSAYVGQQIILRFAFRSYEDLGYFQGVYSGVYI